MSTYKPTKRICAARAKQGRRTKRIDIWMTPDEVAVLDRLADRMRLFTNGVPASRSFVCRKAIEVLGTHLRPAGMSRRTATSCTSSRIRRQRPRRARRHDPVL
jgi:hypothetical protein